MTPLWEFGRDSLVECEDHRGAAFILLRSPLHANPAAMTELESRWAVSKAETVKLPKAETVKLPQPSLEQQIQSYWFLNKLWRALKRQGDK